MGKLRKPYYPHPVKACFLFNFFPLELSRDRNMVRPFHKSFGPLSSVQLVEESSVGDTRINLPDYLLDDTMGAGLI